MNANGIQGRSMPALFSRFRLQRGLAFGVIIITALLAFEVFNYSTTDYALSDLLGNLKFAGVRWATILTIAFCGIDFAGIARLFTPDEGSRGAHGAHGQMEVWYLFGAWLLAATMNAMLTWWGVSLAILGHQTLGNAVIERETLLRIVPIFVAVLVWLIRVLIIGTFSVAGDRLFSIGEQRPQSRALAYPKASAASTQFRSLSTRASGARTTAASTTLPRPNQRTSEALETSYNNRPEPTYHPLSASASNNTTGVNSLMTRPPLNRPGSQMRR
jgi:hypothetical protein